MGRGRVVGKVVSVVRTMMSIRMMMVVVMMRISIMVMMLIMVMMMLIMVMMVMIMVMMMCIRVVMMHGTTTGHSRCSQRSQPRCIVSDMSIAIQHIIRGGRRTKGCSIIHWTVGVGGGRAWCI